MRIIDWKTLKTMIPYSRQHLSKLEKLGRFPKRLVLGTGRVGWLLHEIEEWIMERASQR